MFEGQNMKVLRITAVTVKTLRKLFLEIYLNGQTERNSHTNVKQNINFELRTYGTRSAT